MRRYKIMGMLSICFRIQIFIDMELRPVTRLDALERPISHHIRHMYLR